MGLFGEQLLIYGLATFICLIIVLGYILSYNRKSRAVARKVANAKEEGLFEPVSLYPHIDPNLCIGSGACVKACPEKDILGLIDGRASVIHASECVGHGACFHACPVEAISLRIGTEKRGVDLPHVSERFETNIEGIYIAGELGGMGLIRNSVEQGQQAMKNMVARKRNNPDHIWDAVIVGAGPAGIAATLEAKKWKMRTITLEQDSMGGTVYTFPRTKIVMTSPMDLPLYGKVKLKTTNKAELLNLWTEVLDKNELSIQEKTKVESIQLTEEGYFNLATNTGKGFLTQQVLLALGRRGTPRKLGVEGEDRENVFYRLLDPEQIEDLDVLVVGGGDSAVESAMLLMDQNRVTLSYRKDKFAGIKPRNREKILSAIEDKKLTVVFSSAVTSIREHDVVLDLPSGSQKIPNDLVYIMIGGELPIRFLEDTGIKITKKFGQVVKKYQK